MAKHKHSRKQFIKLFTEYGIHIWAILIIANAAMLYAYQFSTHAASKTNETLHTLNISQAPSPSISLSPSPSPSTAPLGPSINLQFSVPGIGSGGGVMKPLHYKRSLIVYLYAPDANSLNPAVKPLYTIQTFANFDSNQLSPTYTSFLNPLIDLGSDVKDGDYQIAFRTDQSLRTLIKQNPTDLGGEIIGLNRSPLAIVIPPQTVLMGDTLPIQGDNTININDYNAFVTCYGKSNNTNSFCKTGNYGDFNDDGVIDGIDYNILLRSLYVVAQEGLAVPQLSPSPPAPNRVTKIIHPITPTVQPKKLGPTPTTSVSAANKKGGSAIGAILFILFLIVLGAIGFLLYFKNENVRTLIRSIIHLSPTGTPSTETSTADTTTPTEQTEQSDTTTTESTAVIAQTPPADTSSVAEQSTQEQATPETQPQSPSQPSAAGDTLEKDCYIKTKGKDEAGTGMWLLLTDDNGAVNAHYSKIDAKDGFAKVKGVMKEENGKKFLEISELTMEG